MLTKIIKIGLCFLCSLVVLFCLIFTFIELRSAFAGDSQLMYNPTISLAGYILRALYFIFGGVSAGFLFYYIVSKKKAPLILLVAIASIFVSTVALYFFYMLVIALVFSTLFVILTIAVIFKFCIEF